MKNLRATATAFLLINALLLSGCAEQTPAPGMDTSLELTESNFEYSLNERSEMSVADSSPENISEDSTSSDNEYQPYKTEIFLDQQYLKTVEKGRLHVCVNLWLDDEALRKEFNEIYTDIGDDPIHWFRFLCDRGEQIVRDFMLDYNINYEDFSVLRSNALFNGVLDKDTVSLMLNDLRVTEIVYYPTGFPVFTE